MIYEFYCDPGKGCDTDVQFWYRLTPSPVGAGECKIVYLFDDNKLLFDEAEFDIKNSPDRGKRYLKN